MQLIFTNQGYGYKPFLFVLIT